MANDLPLNPDDRLVAVKREFGEWGGVNLSTENSVTYSVMNADSMPAIFQGQLNPDNGGCYLYGRSLNPTVRVLGRMLAAMEGTEAGYCCASGMAAISCCLLRLCNTGDHIVASNTIYGGTYALLKDFLPKKCGITTTFVPISNLTALEAAINPNTKVIFCESISNPTLVVADIPRIADISKRHGATFVVDNTFAPMILSPALLGADIVVHSLTKFISGGSDAIAGAICGSKAFVWSLMDLHEGPLMLLGGVMDPKVASDLALRIPHLGVRMAEHSRRAQKYAERLQALGADVFYPGLENHPQHTLLKTLSNPGYGSGGLLTIELDSLPLANAFMERLQNTHGFGIMAVSLGYFDTLMSASASSTSSELTGADMAKAGISPGLVRMSVGLTGSVELRLQQLEEAYCYIQAMALSLARPPAPATFGVSPTIGEMVLVGSEESLKCDIMMCDSNGKRKSNLQDTVVCIAEQEEKGGRRITAVNDASQGDVQRTKDKAAPKVADISAWSFNRKWV